MNNLNNNLFFTITIKDEEIHFNSREYTFAIQKEEQKLGTKGNSLWYYEFDELLGLDLKWVSWNQNRNETKSWEYLLLKVNQTLYSGFINKSKTQSNLYYCELKVLPPKAEEIFIFR